MNTAMSLALETNACNGIGQASCQSSKDNVGELLQTWSTLSTTLASNDATLVNVATNICNVLSKRNSFDALEVFLERLPKSSEYTNNHEILRSKISLALKRHQTKVVQDIIKVGLLTFILFASSHRRIFVLQCPAMLRCSFKF